jgi:Ca2+-binding RTX toxin-like protein
LAGGDGADSLNGGAGSDTLVGAAGADTLDGGADDDLLLGDAVWLVNGIILETDTGASDTLNSDDGDDVLKGGAGADALDGGVGLDTAEYSDKTFTVVATLNGSGNAIVAVRRFAEDTIVNIENLIGGSAADTLTGDDRANLFRGGGGADHLDGGAGSDTADFSDKTASVVATLNGATNATATVGGDAEDTMARQSG